MRIKKFRAGTMREALLKIKEDLGEEAVILKTSKIPKGILALGGSEIEVTAASEQETARPQAFEPIKMADPAAYDRRGASQQAPPAPGEAVPLAHARKGATTMLRELAATAKREGAAGTSSILEIKEDIRQLRDVVITALNSPGEENRDGGFSGGWALLYRRLIESEVKPVVAAKLIADAQSRYASSNAHVDDSFVAALGESFPVAGPLKMRDDGPLYVAFVGPTGAGKTTTLAKLAAQYVLNKQASVSIITADTYRIAAIEQVRVFADIIGIGLQVVFSPDEVAAARSACENDDVVFIDTAGRSQKNVQHMADLKVMLNALQPHETHLVVSAATKDSDLEDIITRYGDAGVNRLVFTKLDETTRLGSILNAVGTARIPVSYFTTGQSVPDDIELAHTGRFVRRLWEGAPL